MKIQELEFRTGLERPSIRFYEKEGLLKPSRLENGYRDYSEEDAELLKKIKLLRRLGMSIEDIRQLQRGSEDLSTAIARQSGFHTSQIDDHKRCLAVCKAIREDGAEFASLDAEHYLRLLREIKINDQPLDRTNFQENIPKEIHPWRRWFARWLDYLLWGAFANFIWIVLLRIRPIPGDYGSTLFSIAAMALYVPMEALLLHKFGTTPGKYMMGIRLEYIQGGNLPYAEALYRSLRVYTVGAGMGIPFVSLILYIFRYCQLTGRSWRRFARYDQVEGPQEMPWDEETEFVYSNWNLKRGVALVVSLAVFAGLTVWGVLDGFKPRYRGDELTVSQVAANYNATLQVLRENSDYSDKLREDGTREPVPSNTVIFDLNSSVGNNRMEFSYDVQDGFVRSVSVHQEWDQVFWLAPLEGDITMMVSSLLLAQEGCGIVEFREFLMLFGTYQNQKNVSFEYRNLFVEWNISSEKDMLQGIIAADSKENVTASLDFRITIRK